MRVKGYKGHKVIFAAAGYKKILIAVFHKDCYSFVTDAGFAESFQICDIAFVVTKKQGFREPVFHIFQVDGAHYSVVFVFTKIYFNTNEAGFDVGYFSEILNIGIALQRKPQPPLVSSCAGCPGSLIFFSILQLIFD